MFDFYIEIPRRLQDTASSDQQFQMRPRRFSRIAAPGQFPAPAAQGESKMQQAPVPAYAGIENETFNVLKTNGCNLEHNFGTAGKPSPPSW